MMILCDLHGTLLNENEQINDVVADCLRGFAYRKYDICLITAANLHPLDKAKIENLLKVACLPWDNIYSPNEESKDDVKTKETLLNQIIKSYGDPISLAIDNRKDVCKMYRKHRIDTMRFKESDYD
jgi:hydroxymethylpyrimidine pyrophosphatase-like HAD family hydrolase